jgi:hypothetical protein
MVALALDEIGAQHLVRIATMIVILAQGKMRGPFQRHFFMFTWHSPTQIGRQKSQRCLSLYSMIRHKVLTRAVEGDCIIESG